MSYEGYVQLLCEEGHQTSYGVYDYDRDKLCRCGAKFVWRNSVDVTNNEWSQDEEGNMVRCDGYVALEVESYDRCECCNHVNEIVYKIPTDKGQRIE